VDTASPDKLDLAKDDLVDKEVVERAFPPETGQNDAAAALYHVDRLNDRRDRSCRDIQDDVGKLALGDLANALDRILLIHVDRGRCADLSRQCEPSLVTTRSRDDDSRRTRATRHAFATNAACSTGNQSGCGSHAADWLISAMIRSFSSRLSILP
jgi:hypothetical protein